MSGIDPKQLRDLVVRPVLAALDMGGDVAEKLVLGTAAQESGFAALHQRGGGPALSLWQIEPATAMDAMQRAPVEALLKLRAFLGWQLMSPGDVIAQLPGNLYLGAAMCRLVYYLKPFRMPQAWDLTVIAAIYKKHYNGPGAATAAEFIANYQRLVAPIYD
jgi:hypothetical protein